MTVPAGLITFEGMDGAGKSSHIAGYAAALQRLGQRVVVTREPGGTELAEAIRSWLLQRAMSMRVEALLAFAARQDHLEQVIRPALAQGIWVVCDRFTDSTMAYQGGGRGLAQTELEVLERWVHPDLQPIRTYLFDLAPEVASARRQAVRDADRFEAESLDFFLRVRAAYLARAAAAHNRFVVVDGAQSYDVIECQLHRDLLEIMQSRGGL